DWVQGTCLALAEDCLADIGGFDEGFYMYAEEMDLCWRARAHGWRVRYISDAVVEHVGGGSTGDPAVHARRSMHSEARFMAHAYGRKVLPRWRAARVVGALIKIPLLAPAGVVDRRPRDRLRWQVAALRTVLGHDWEPALEP